MKRINEQGREVALCLSMGVHEPGLSLRQVHDNDLNNLAKAISGFGNKATLDIFWFETIVWKNLTRSGRSRPGYC